MSTKAQHLDTPPPPKETLPTMHDLPSEEIGEPGVPDFFHLWQPRLLEDTFQSPVYPPDELCIAADVNLYYDVHDTSRYKRPDWFVAVGVRDGRALRDSYVIWQEGAAPLVVVELLSESTRDEDLGRRKPRKLSDPPTKWEAYERLLRIPYYVVFSRHTDELKIFELAGARYREVTEHQGRFWVEEVELGLGLWEGGYHDNHRLWLRWYDKAGNWIPTPQEKADAEQQRADRLADKLRALGLDPERI